MLVIIGATPEGKKELVGLIDGVRESAQSWRELLLDLKRRGLAVAPDLAIADGALGFWKAIEEVWPRTRSQRCWVHKTANVLNKLPKSRHSKAKRALQEIWMAETRNDADSAFDAFIETYAVKYDKAAACLVKDRRRLRPPRQHPRQATKDRAAPEPARAVRQAQRDRAASRDRGMSGRSHHACCPRRTPRSVAALLAADRPDRRDARAPRAPRTGRAGSCGCASRQVASAPCPASWRDLGS